MMVLAHHAIYGSQPPNLIMSRDFFMLNLELPFLCSQPSVFAMVIANIEGGGGEVVPYALLNCSNVK